MRTDPLRTPFRRSAKGFSFVAAAVLLAMAMPGHRQHAADSAGRICDSHGSGSYQPSHVYARGGSERRTIASRHVDGHRDDCRVTNLDFDQRHRRRRNDGDACKPRHRR